MKRIWKRLGAVLMTAAMALGMMTGAGAADDAVAAPFSKQATVTVNGIANGDQLSAYQLVSYDESYNNYVFNSDFQAFVDGYSGLTGGKTEDRLEKCTNVTKLLEDYAAKVSEGNYQLPQNPVVADAAGNAATVTLNPGYYLLLVTTNAANSKVYQPMSVFAKVEGDKLIVYGGGDVAGQENALTMDVKSQDGPTIDKKVNATQGEGEAIEWRTAAAAGVGETAKFYVQVTIPKYQDITTMEMTLHDTMTAMEYKEGSLKVYTEGPDANGAFSADKLLGTEGAVTEEPGNYADGQQTLTFTLNYSKIMGSDTTSKSIWIYYEATVKPEAADGKNVHSAANAVYLSYNTAAGSYQTETKNTTVYNYEFKLNKRTGEQATSLAGAGFTLYNDEACTEPISFVQDGDHYRPAMSGETGAVQEIPADFLIVGLDANTYYVKETTTPRGFFQPESAFQLILKSNMVGQTHTGALEGSDCDFKELSDADGNLVAQEVVDTARQWCFIVTLKNISTPLLPTTGGPGTVAISIAGVLLMILGAALYMGYRKKRAQN